MERGVLCHSSLKRLVNVYQLHYTNGVAQGLGDYIRGSFCLLQIAVLLGLQFDMDIINHPMSKYIQRSDDATTYAIDYKRVAKYENTNYIPISAKCFKKNSELFLNDFINTMNCLNTTVDNYYTFCNSFPIFEHYSLNARSFIRSKLSPNDVMIKHIAKRMDLLGLSYKKFGIIHIRTGDKYLLKNKSIHPLVIRQISTILIKNINPGKKYLIISDNNQIKFALKRVFPQLIIQISSIVHLGEQADNSDVGLIDTLVDFFIMSNASRIISFSPYNWGSGFSQWCSILHNIPFFQFQITDTL